MGQRIGRLAGWAIDQAVLVLVFGGRVALALDDVPAPRELELGDGKGVGDPPSQFAGGVPVPVFEKVEELFAVSAAACSIGVHTWCVVIFIEFDILIIDGGEVL